MSQLESNENAILALLTTDNHLGYMERDPIRCDDSLNTFEEILQIARDRKVDVILHSGDLFHDNKPSRKTLNRTIELLRTYCLGDSQCTLEFLSDGQRIFSGSKFPGPNYLDPNFNVAIPVFAIHGNHDDPAGEGNLSAWDILGNSGLVNYFGRSLEADNIRVTPILLQKGTCRLALYGLGNIRDERLHRTFLQKRVEFMRADTEFGHQDFFSLFMLHQNRVKHGETNYIPEEFLPKFLDLVVWGHEHECRPLPEYNHQMGFSVIQPGSSVATSCCEAESERKYAFLLKIQDGSFEVETIQLKSQRPFVMKDICLGDHFTSPETMQYMNDKAAHSENGTLQPSIHSIPPVPEPEQINDFLVATVRSMLDEAKTLKHSDYPDMLPLIRIRVDYSGGFTPLNPQTFGQQFVNGVANPKDLLLIQRRRYRNPHRSGIKGFSSNSQSNHTQCQHGSKTKGCSGAIDVDVEDEEDGPNIIKIEKVVHSRMVKQRLNILPVDELLGKVRQFIEKEDRYCIEGWLKSFHEDVVKSVRSVYDIQELRQSLQHYRQRRALLGTTSALVLPSSTVAHAELSELGETGNNLSGSMGDLGFSSKRASSPIADPSYSRGERISFDDDENNEKSYSRKNERVRTKEHESLNGHSSMQLDSSGNITNSITRALKDEKLDLSFDFDSLSSSSSYPLGALKANSMMPNNQLNRNPTSFDYEQHFSSNYQSYTLGNSSSNGMNTSNRTVYEINDDDYKSHKNTSNGYHMTADTMMHDVNTNRYTTTNQGTANQAKGYQGTGHQATISQATANQGTGSHETTAKGNQEVFHYSCDTRSKQGKKGKADLDDKDDDVYEEPEYFDHDDASEENQINTKKRKARAISTRSKGVNNASSGTGTNAGTNGPSSFRSNGSRLKSYFSTNSAAASSHLTFSDDF